MGSLDIRCLHSFSIGQIVIGSVVPASPFALLRALSNKQNYHRIHIDVPTTLFLFLTQLPRRKTKMFRFTPTPVSSAGIFWWTGFEGFSTRGCVLDPEVPQWWDDRFPPLAIYQYVLIPLMFFFRFFSGSLTFSFSLAVVKII